jgi:hypothetical protein
MRQYKTDTAGRAYPDTNPPNATCRLSRNHSSFFTMKIKSPVQTDNSGHLAWVGASECGESKHMHVANSLLHMVDAKFSLPLA